MEDGGTGTGHGASCWTVPAPPPSMKSAADAASEAAGWRTAGSSSFRAIRGWWDIVCPGVEDTFLLQDKGGCRRARGGQHALPLSIHSPPFSTCFAPQMGCTRGTGSWGGREVSIPTPAPVPPLEPIFLKQLSPGSGHPSLLLPLADPAGVPAPRCCPPWERPVPSCFLPARTLPTPR